MRKKHFIALAESIRRYQGRSKEILMTHPVRFTESQIGVLADFCASQSPRFKRERWLAFIRGECGPSGGKVKGENQ